MQDKHWSNLLKSAKERNCYFQVIPIFSIFLLFLFFFLLLLAIGSTKRFNLSFQIQKPYSSFFAESNMSSMRTSQHDNGPHTLDIEEDTEITMFNSGAGVNLSNEMDQEINLEDHDDMDVDGGYDED